MINLPTVQLTAAQNGKVSGQGTTHPQSVIAANPW